MPSGSCYYDRPRRIRVHRKHNMQGCSSTALLKVKLSSVGGVLGRFLGWDGAFFYTTASLPSSHSPALGSSDSLSKEPETRQLQRRATSCSARLRQGDPSDFSTAGSGWSTSVMANGGTLAGSSATLAATHIAKHLENNQTHLQHTCMK